MSNNAKAVLKVIIFSDGFDKIISLQYIGVDNVYVTGATTMLRHIVRLLSKHNSAIRQFHVL